MRTLFCHFHGYLRSRIVRIHSLFWLFVVLTAPQMVLGSDQYGPENGLTDRMICQLNRLQVAAETDTVGEIRAYCDDIAERVNESTETNPEENRNLVKTRLLLERSASENRFAILQHRPNYVLPLSYNRTPNNAPFSEVAPDRELDRAEFKFQISLKLALTDNTVDSRLRGYAAYTNQSYWQVFDTDNSSPFRETVHEPEFFLDFDSDINLGNWRVPLLRLGAVHQSNGRSGSLSRSWNRIYAQMFAEKRNYAITFKPWVRLSDSSDDNPDIEDFIGNFELGLFRKGNRSNSAVRLRHNLESPARMGVQLDYTLPIPGHDSLRFYLQYFYGYGESLIDYNARSNRFSLGIQTGDLL
ncbi:MAG: phospholipase A [Pseudomonadota bacterium]